MSAKEQLFKWNLTGPEIVGGLRDAGVPSGGVRRGEVRSGEVRYGGLKDG